MGGVADPDERKKTSLGGVSYGKRKTGRELFYQRKNQLVVVSKEKAKKRSFGERE